MSLSVKTEDGRKIIAGLYDSTDVTQAKELGYDNSKTGIEADNIQDAFDQVFTNIKTLEDLTGNETITGKYKDRNGNVHDVYMKMLHLTSPSASSYTTIYTHPEKISILYYEGRAYASDGAWLPLPYTDGSARDIIYCTNTGGLIMYSSESKFRNQPVDIKIYYYKL